MEEEIQSVTTSDTSEWKLVQRRLDDLENLVTDLKLKLETLGECKCNRSSYLETEHSEDEETETIIGLIPESYVHSTVEPSTLYEGSQSTTQSEEILTLALSGVEVANNTVGTTSTTTTGSSSSDKTLNTAENGTPVSTNSLSRLSNGIGILELKKYRPVEVRLKRCDQVEVTRSSSSSAFRNANNKSKLRSTNMEANISSKKRPVLRRTGNGPRRELTSTPPSSHKKRFGFVCHFCSRGFHGKSYLARHIRVHTGETGDKPFHCNICSKAFTQKSSLKTHTRIHSGVKPFECGFCPKKFNESQGLVMHVRSHTGERPYTCQFCSKEFTGLGNLQVHLRVHTREKPYSCTFCSKAFTQRNDLQKHLSRHAGETPQ